VVNVGALAVVSVVATEVTEVAVETEVGETAVEDVVVRSVMRRRSGCP
jgi:hypothetical protein